MKTIIQTIGPLYGDDANGTVFGQPNGSVYTPPANTLIVLSENPSANKVLNGIAYVTTAISASEKTARATFAVVSQVDWNAIYELATDSNFANIVSVRRPTIMQSTITMGQFGLNSGYTVVNGTTYYGRIRIVSTDGSAPIATSNTYTFEGIA